METHGKSFCENPAIGNIYGNAEQIIKMVISLISNYIESYSCYVFYMVMHIAVCYSSVSMSLIKKVSFNYLSLVYVK